MRARDVVVERARRWRRRTRPGRSQPLRGAEQQVDRPTRPTATVTGEGLEGGVDLGVLAPPAPVRGLGADEVHGEAGLEQVGHGDRGAGVTAHSSEPVGPAAAVGVGPRVEQDDGAALGRPVLLAHHEVPGAGRGGPVDAAQVVAVAVLADG